MHAVLITAYKDYPSLLRLVRRLDRGFFKTYIHIDRRSRISRSERAELSRHGATIINNRFVRWGSISHLLAIMDLLRLATAEADVDYIHIISGQDYPLVDAETFRSRCDGRIFMNFEPVGEYASGGWFGGRLIQALARGVHPGPGQAVVSVAVVLAAALIALAVPRLVTRRSPS